jgi:hypothetical protein
MEAEMIILFFVSVIASAALAIALELLPDATFRSMKLIPMANGQGLLIE